MEIPVSRPETTHKTDFAIKESGKGGEPCFQEGDHKANFAVRMSGRLGVERLSLIGEPCIKAGDHTQDRLCNKGAR